MRRVLTSESLPWVEVEPREGDDGAGVSVTLHVPGYQGPASFTLEAERDADGDWRVYIPWFKDLHGNPAADHADLELQNGVGVTNGICYVGAPDVEIVVE